MAQHKHTVWNAPTHAKRKRRKRWLPHHVKERKHQHHPVEARRCSQGPHQYELRCLLCDTHIQWLSASTYERIKANDE